jgi:hypothetical protein
VPSDHRADPGVLRAAWSGGRISIASVVPLVDAILAAPFSPVVSNGMAEGLRIGAAIPVLGLEAGDVVIAIGTDR